MASARTAGSPEWWLERLLQRMSNELARYEVLDNYAKGNAPPPNGDRRYVRALRDLQEKAKTNYISLVLKATTQRMRVRDFKIKGEADHDAKMIWRYNNLELQSATAISDAAKFSCTYALVSPPGKDGVPVITIEDPRFCTVEPDPLNQLNSIAGLKIYADYILNVTVAVLYLPKKTYIYHGALSSDGTMEIFDKPNAGASAAAGFELKRTFRNPLGKVQLIRGLWQPDTGLAECEDGAFAIQDRINHTLLDRLIISKNQAYRQRLITGLKIPVGKNGQRKPPFDPGSDAVWVTEDKDAKAWDLDQADINQLLEAVRDDIGDLASTTQTPVTYLTNRMVNVSGDALKTAQSSHVAKVQERMAAMGWFFLAVMRTAFLYQDDPRAQEIDAEVKWHDPEIRTLTELGEFITKAATSGVPLNLVLERTGFSDDEIKRAMAEVKRKEEEEHKREIELREAQSQAAARNVAQPNQPQQPSPGG